MSRTLIQEGLIALKEVAQGKVTDHAAGWGTSYRDEYNSIGSPKSLTAPMSRGTGTNLIPSWEMTPDDPFLTTNKMSLDKYRKMFPSIKGTYSRRNIDGNYSEWRPSSGASLEVNKKRRQNMLDAGGLQHSDGSITYQDPYQQERSINNLRKTINRNGGQSEVPPGALSNRYEIAGQDFMRMFKMPRGN